MEKSKVGGTNKGAKVIQFGDLIPDDDIRKIDPEDFHVPTSDSQGHSTRFQFRGLKQMRAMVGEAIQTKQFPYRTDSDLYRHALIRHLRWLTDLGYIGVNNIFVIDAISEIARDDENHQQFMLSIGQLEERVRYHRREGSMEVAKQMVDRVKELIEKMPEGPWKTGYRKEFKKRFPDLV